LGIGHADDNFTSEKLKNVPKFDATTRRRSRKKNKEEEDDEAIMMIKI